MLFEFMDRIIAYLVAAVFFNHPTLLNGSEFQVSEGMRAALRSSRSILVDLPRAAFTEEVDRKRSRGALNDLVESILRFVPLNCDRLDRWQPSSDGSHFRCAHAEK